MMKLRRIPAALVTVLAVATAATAVIAQTETPASRATFRREVAVTFDDLPATHGDLAQMRSITPRLLKSIAAHKVPTIGFVNEGKLFVRNQRAERTALLRMWLDAGHDLGNHTYSHVQIDRTPLVAYQADVIRGETVTKALLAERGKTLRYFRHPQLRTGPTVEYKQALDRFLAGRGYTIAPITIDNHDNVFATVYANAKRRGDEQTARRVADAYVPYMEGIFDFFERLSIETFGYEVKQTLLLHANELNADRFDELARMMRRRGYTFISLEAALKDQSYSLPDAQHGRGLSWIHRWRLARGLPLRLEPDEPEFVSDLFKAGRR